MIGILLITHENLGENLISCATHVMGMPLPQLSHLGVFKQDQPDAISAKASALIRELDSGEGVLVLSDIYGATPCNVGTSLTQAGKVECIAGASLPMLVRVLTYRHEPLTVVVEKALSGGQQGVVHVNPGSDHAN
ncbi:PTS system, ascorbate-specific IIA component [Nitrosomonas sp. PY1]|uniref:PTS sugar transporter subunit IIA n=1 Tax=Nitrosomonas sp. PY1 TaxID=1803906 RepID=UPI001FC8D551|nr:PTS fructose transporter subunit IIA [Nitrosomonas sp. PY1]GKS70062.1 PTS system, ascorbate-specific IIA component [Nitrosomonas sp. PY1]